jgi:hypothetical protein
MAFKDIDAFLESEAAPAGSAVGAGAQRPPIVVVDDDETIRKALVALFTKRYAVTAYGSAK